MATNPSKDPASPAAPAQSAARDEVREAFEHFDELAHHVERMAVTGTTGNTAEWSAFIIALNEVAGKARQSATLSDDLAKARAECERLTKLLHAPSL